MINGKRILQGVILLCIGLIILQFSIYIKPEFAKMLVKGMFSNEKV